MCCLCVQDLKGKILVKGKKERVVKECSSSSSEFSSSDEESCQADGKARGKKEDKKVCSTPPSHTSPSSGGSHQYVILVFGELSWDSCLLNQ